MPGHYSSTCLVLLVEDDTMIGLSLEDDITGAGYRVAGPFTTCAGALVWLSTETPDLAVLDIVLRDGPCKDLAAELTRRDVPFVVYSAVSQRRNTIQEFMGAPWIEKPATSKMLLDALTGLQTGLMCREG